MNKSSSKTQPSKTQPSKTQIDLARLGSRFTRFLLVIAVILMALEFVVHRYGETDIEDSFMFPAIYGFIAFIFIVEIGKILRRLIMRDENYYDDQEDSGEKNIGGGNIGENTGGDGHVR